MGNQNMLYIHDDSASYFSFTGGGVPIKQNPAYLRYVDVKCVGDVNKMGQVRKSGSNIMFLFSNNTLA